ncbi:efflux RND transporter periplasmic adaptor subunit [Pandoraea norimbergensis]|uniref:Efflux transporter periplasmic adaptor subunit n=1 Tax=Pandoraea norimbergensis TaxID=93219 RepID=A0ABN4JLZ3_9BURK|nr:HlyD family secretion protein [Pandoraea norimbergensis]ALS62080.1 efflux transporter periplasmic adaptor subunit [Pandoraea norimbergensis]
MSNRALWFRPVAKAAGTLAVVGLAVVLVVALWRAYVVAPWTRDGRVSAEVVRIAPEISGTVQDVAVVDNQFVRRGDLLYRVDPERFRLAVSQAEAQLSAARAILQQKQQDARRRRGMDDLVPGEEIQRAGQAVAIAVADQRRAQVALDVARLDLARTELRAPVDGYVTHLRLRPGDYAVAGHASIALLDAHSFWITGYFEETKLRGIHAGAPARIRLMGFDDLIDGHVASIGRGITDANERPDSQGLPSVEPTFSWVRLAQRIPVRVAIDRVPPGIVLAAGMTCSVDVGPSGQGAAPKGALASLLMRWMS